MHKKQSMIAAKAKPKSRARKYYSDSDDDFTDSYTNAARLKDPSELWETSSEYNVVLLTGPPGSGKSAAIHAVSSECKYTVIEMNSSERRSGKAVQDKCDPQLQPHTLGGTIRYAASRIGPKPKGESPAATLKPECPASTHDIAVRWRCAEFPRLADTTNLPWASFQILMAPG